VKVSYVNLGCPKNYIDLEVILGELGEDIVITENLQDSDVTIINTCAFLDIAKQESIDTIFDVLQVKEHNPNHKVLVTGCLPQRYQKELVKEIPEVDRFFDSIDAHVTAKDIKKFLNIHSRKLRLRKLVTANHYAYLKIAKGCSNRCSYCAIPIIKGPFQSRPFQDVIDEAHLLVEEGVRELIVVAQDTTSYGRDLVPDTSLVTLLAELNRIPDLQWIRLMYTHPAHWTDELIEAVANLDKVVKYIEMPIQHISDRILKLMRRRVTRSEIENLIETLRAKIPGVALRTSLIVGFPGETEDEFEELLTFVEAAKFERLGVFTYSREEGTPAFSMQDNVPAEVKEQRRDAIMEVQTDIIAEKNLDRVGQTLSVIVDEIDQANNLAIGRSEWDAPEIDNSVLVSPPPSIGEIIPVRIISADVYDLFAEPIQS